MELITEEDFTPIWNDTIGKTMKCLNKGACVTVNGMSEESEKIYTAVAEMSYSDILEGIKEGRI